MTTPFANSPSHSSSLSTDEFKPRTMTHVCSPVSSLCVCRRYSGIYPARFQNLRVVVSGDGDRQPSRQVHIPQKLRCQTVGDTEVVQSFRFTFRQTLQKGRHRRRRANLGHVGEKRRVLVCGENVNQHRTNQRDTVVAARTSSKFAGSGYDCSASIAPSPTSKYSPLKYAFSAWSARAPYPIFA